MNYYILLVILRITTCLAPDLGTPDGFFFAQLLKVGILVEVISVIASVEKESEIQWIQWICWSIHIGIH